MSSPIRSPFKNIANCVARVLQWSQSNESPNKGDQAFQEKSSDNHFESKSRSVSPEIPKLEEPTKYVMKDANKSGDKKSAAIKDKDSEDGKKIMGLIENFRDMKGACNNWAGILLNTNIQLVVYSWFPRSFN